MNWTHPWLTRVITLCATLTALTITPAGPADADGSGTTVRTVDGQVRGAAVGDVDEFLGLPYAAPPVGSLRWQAPQPVRGWRGVRDATEYGASCPQPLGTGFQGPGPFSEDCLFLNVFTSSAQHTANRPVIVWFHGGGFTQDTSTNYDGAKLAAHGAVVVTVNYRLGALGFLAHPAFAERPGGPSGNYGLMDQQAALRWVHRNIEAFGGDRHNVTIDGQSAGGVSVLAHLVARRSRGLFQRAIVQSGAFAVNQVPLANAEAFGESFADAVGCSNQSADCLRDVPVDTLVATFPPAAIPGVVDGRVLTEPIGTALAAGRFAHVPLINGINHIEEFLFVAGLGLAVVNGQFVRVPNDVRVPQAVSEATYESAIASTLSVSSARAADIAAHYPQETYGIALVALSVLTSDANFACPALEVDRVMASHGVPTYGYEFDDDTAPQRFGALPPIVSHSGEIQYLFDQPNTPIAATLDATQAALADKMQTAWARFAAGGDPSTDAVPWPSFNSGSPVLSFASPTPNVLTNVADAHHCDFWAAN